MSTPELPLALRVPTLEWSTRNGRGDLKRLSWVDLDPNPHRLPYRERRLPGEGQVFTQGPLLASLPPSIAGHVEDAQAQGRATAWEGLRLILSRSEWLVGGREHLWAPWSAEPRLLAAVAETFGVEPAVHRMSPEVLSRLAALLPGWHAHRGSLARALEVIDAAGLRALVQPWLPPRLPPKPSLRSPVPHEQPLQPPRRGRPKPPPPRMRQEIADLDDETEDVTVAPEDEPPTERLGPAQVQVAPDLEVIETLPESDDDDATAGAALDLRVAGVRRIDVLPEAALARVPASAPAPSAAGGELLACRNLAWWLARTERSAGTELVISGGFTRLLRAEPPGPSEQDVALGWARVSLPPALFRLLPPWVAVRLRETPDTTA